MLKTKKCFENVYNLKISVDNKFIIAVSKRIIVYRFDNLEVIAKFGEISNPSKIAISSDNKLLAIKSTIGKIGLYSLENLSLIETFKATKDAGDGSNIWFTPDSIYIIDGDWNGNIRLINIQDSTTLVIKSYDNCMIENIEYCDKDQIYHIYKFNRSGYNFVTKWKYDINKKQIFELNESNHIREIGDRLVYNNKFNYYAYLSTRNKRYERKYEIVLINDSLNSVLFSKKIGPWININRDISFSPDGHYLAVILNDKLQIYSNNPIELLKDIPIDDVQKLGISPDSQYICVCTQSNKGYIFNIDELLETPDLTIDSSNDINPETFLDSLLENGINKDLILSIPEDIRLEILGRYTLKKADKNRVKSLYDSILKLPYDLKLLYFVWEFQEEIACGGISQYLTNTLSNTRNNLIEFLKEIGSEKIYNFIKKHLYVSGLKETQWQVLEEEYEGLSEDIEGMVIKYISENIDRLTKIKI